MILIKATALRPMILIKATALSLNSLSKANNSDQGNSIKALRAHSGCSDSAPAGTGYWQRSKDCSFENPCCRQLDMQQHKSLPVKLAIN